MSIALAPVAVAGLMSRVGAPIGLLALKGSLGNLKSTVGYCRRHKAGIAGLVKRIEKNAEIILPILDQYEDLTKKAAAGDPAAKKALKIFKHKVNKSESRVMLGRLLPISIVRPSVILPIWWINTDAL